MVNDDVHAVNASFRDPSGFLFRRGGVLLRQVNQSYREHYEHCIESGLYEELMSKGLLISHREIDDPGLSSAKYRVLYPEELPFVSYPYEWSFSQLKDAALLTLDIQSTCLESGLSLKDASAFNVQFYSGKPIFIDSLSFEKYKEGVPWVAYKQFCQHFLGPLTLMARTDLRSRQLLMRYVDGIPVDLVSAMLPASTHFRYSTWAHIHMHARSQRRHQHDARTPDAIKVAKLSRRMFVALIASLKSAVKKLTIKDVSTEWGQYYEDTNYSDCSMGQKEVILKDLADKHLGGEPIVHDLGANTGRFSRIIAGQDKLVVAHDIDEMAVECHYRNNKERGVSNVLPLVLDLTNPTPAVGWDSKERSSFHERVRGTPVVALALVHHLCISNGVPLDKLAEFFSGIARKLIIEFVPKKDSQVQRLLATRHDVFEHYDRQNFEREFAKHFQVGETKPVEGSDRVIYYMES